MSESSKTVSSEEIGARVIAALGLPSNVTSINIELEAGKPALIHVSLSTWCAELDAMVDDLKSFQLVAVDRSIPVAAA